MTKYREIIRLNSLGFSGRNIALTCNVSRNTVSKVLKQASEQNLSWPLDESLTEQKLEELLFKRTAKTTTRRLPSFEYIRKEMMKTGVNKKLLWVEYCNECRMNNEEPLMYSRFCYYIQKAEEKRMATMHIPRKPGEQIEVDWAGNPASIIDSFTGEIIPAWLFVGVLTYSQYAYVEAFINEKSKSWITAHIHMYEFFGGVTPMLVPDNCSTAVNVRKGDWYSPSLNTTYHEMAEHYNTAIIPARVRKPKDKANAEGTVRNISTWITAALRNEQFFSLEELNKAIREKLTAYNSNMFQKKESSRLSLFLEEEKPLLGALPAAPYEFAEWKQATVQFNYHVAVDKIYYSVPYQYIRNRVDVRITYTTVEIFFNHERIASHKRLYGRAGQYSTINSHMPPSHQKYLEWDGRRFRKWAENIGPNTARIIDSILNTGEVEQQNYRSCMGILKLAEKYSKSRLEEMCEKALIYALTPSYKTIKNLFTTIKDEPGKGYKQELKKQSHGIIRGASFYKGRKS